MIENPLKELRKLEAPTDRLDYDLRGWDPVEYEYLKVYPAFNSESKISEYTEDGDLIRMGLQPKYTCQERQKLVALVSNLDGQVNMTCPVGKLVGAMVQPLHFGPSANLHVVGPKLTTSYEEK
ncbi:hypothetical protein PPACK8108_LOCUS15818 [Phakopsora pachyrhizi]|uniref:Uncharacterized protein n=1 Tax=Phakopsora pachyrhizi TaxID=170000 RepID=A0AAV0B944_PHAPC|nr:hypothetical protein PPACK8108_LOCUS15818 [Phakopsora pachyrhizi]